MTIKQAWATSRTKNKLREAISSVKKMHGKMKLLAIDPGKSCGRASFSVAWILKKVKAIAADDYMYANIDQKKDLEHWIINPPPKPNKGK